MILSFFTSSLQLLQPKSATNGIFHMKNHVLISLGSNLERGEDVLLQSRRRLQQVYGDILFSTIYRTPAYGKPALPYYNNCVGYFHTDLSCSELTEAFKMMEKEAGRTKEQTGSVALDIDIIQWNDRILKAKDFQRNYVQLGLQEIRPLLPFILSGK